MKSKNLKKLSKNQIDHKWEIKKKLMFKGIYAGTVFALAAFFGSIFLLTTDLWYFGLPILVIYTIQLIVFYLAFSDINYKHSGMIFIIYKWKRMWLPLLMTGNILGALYIGLLVNKK